MGLLIPSFFLLSISVGLISSSSIPIKFGTEYVKPLKCNQGQEYWCHNITTAVECFALKHCIQGVWEKEIPIEKDKSEVCQVCLDMVKTARDQLESNETQEDIKAVLEGSCRLIPIKIVTKECIKLMDDFAPQLIDVLSSQMNPQVVCSVAGLCNNNRILRLEQEYRMNADVSPQSTPLNCDNCNELMVIMGEKLKASSPDSILHFFVEFCGKTGSYSDGCSTLVAMHKVEIYKFLEKIIHGGPICSFAGVCKEKYHNHDKDLVRVPIHTSSIGTKIMNANDDLACDLCVSLVSHLKDILTSNTTEVEFEIVLKGICSQMSVYKNECLKIVDEYYLVVYNFLKEELDGKTLCKQIGVCPSVTKIKQVFLRPLIFDNSETTNKNWIDDLTVNEEIHLPEVLYNPLTMVPSSFLNGKNMPKDKMVCAMCEYVLHFLQQEITLPSTEKEIENYAMRVCTKLPKTVTAQCNSFIQTYMDDFVAILANEIDPSQVCPKIGVCPGDLVLVEYNDKPNCPLCLLAMEEIIHKISDNTEAGITEAMADLCLRDVFPNSLSIDCVKFITENRRAIIEMVLAEFTAQESCVYLDVCVVPNKQDTIKPSGNVGSIQNNEITDEVQEKNSKDSTTCVMCEFVMTKLDQFLKENKTEEEIKHFFLNICKHLPKTVTSQCNDFVNQYADLVLTLLAAELDPKEICTALNLCGNASFVIETKMKECLFCDMLMSNLRNELNCKDSSCSDINKSLQKACLHFPESEQPFCTSMINKIGTRVETALDSLPAGPLVCDRINMCNSLSQNGNMLLALNGERTSCYRGPSYWCQAAKTAAACNKIEYCQKYIWKANKPRRSHNKGRIVIRY